MLHKEQAPNCYTIRHHATSNFWKTKALCSLVETANYDKRYSLSLCLPYQFMLTPIQSVNDGLGGMQIGVCLHPDFTYLQ